MRLEAVVSGVMRRALPAGAGILFDAEARRRFVWALAGSIALAAMELLGLAALLLLMEQLTRPSVVTSPAALRAVFGDPPPRAMLVILGTTVLTVFVVKAAFALRFRWWLLRFIAMQETRTTNRLLLGYVQSSYWRLLQRSGADLVRSMFESAPAVYGMVIGPSMVIATESVTIIAVVSFLLVAMPVPTMAAIVFFGLATISMNRLLRTRARRLGDEMAQAGGRSFRAALDIRYGIKEIKVRRTEDHFVSTFGAARTEWGLARASVVFFSEMPRYVLEVLFVVAALVVIFLVQATAGEGEALALIALFVAAGFRVLPSAVRIVGARTTIRTGLPQMELVIADLLADLAAGTLPSSDAAGQTHRKLPLREALELQDVHFRYPSAEGDVISGVSLRIPAGHSVAFVGASGAGKSTLVDLVLGLHAPSEGRILVDNRPVDSNAGDWQRSIGLVPQDVHLLEASLRSNILLGLEVDEDHLLEVVRKAQLSDLVDALPHGLDSPLGDRGNRVSGGQRQRIGIARALYVKPSLLVLDEATSALDNETERRIGETINGIRGEVTCVVVAHRLSTIRGCDQVVFLESDRVSAVGTFEEVEASSSAFAELVRLGRL